MTGMIATYVIAGVVAGFFCLGLWKIYKSFFHGESDCCSSGCNGSCSHSACEKK